jgi:hypothetical protein
MDSYTLHTDLLDSHLYIFSRWVLELIDSNKDFNRWAPRLTPVPSPRPLFASLG